MIRRFVVPLCCGVLALGGFASGAAADAQTIEGELVDMHCFTKGGAKGEGHAACGTACAKSGIPVGVLVDGKAMTLATNPKPLADAVGKIVRVTGTVNDASMIVLADKVEVKDGDSWKEIKLNDAHHKGGEEK